MPRPRFERSVATGLVARFALAGLVVALGLGAAELYRGRALLRAELARHVGRQVRLAQSRLDRGLDPAALEMWRHAWSAELNDPLIGAARLGLPAGGQITFGNFPDLGKAPMALRRLSAADAAGDIDLDLTRICIIQATLAGDDGSYSLDLAIDGPALRQARRRQVLHTLALNGLLLALLALVGLLLLQRRITGPLSSLLELIVDRAAPESFYRLARHSQREFSQLAQTLGAMLMRLDHTAARLRRSAQRCEHLYQFSPAALISLDESGRITAAKSRAVALFQCATERELIERNLSDFSAKADRPALRRAIDQLDLNPTARCRLRLSVAARTVHAAVECVAVRDEDGRLQSVRLSLLDESPAAARQRELADKSHLLSLVTDHMSDALLLVDASGRITAANRQLGALLQCRPDELVGRRYVPDRLWRPLGVIDHELFVQRLAEIDADSARPAHEQFAADGNTFLFHAIPVHDSAGEPTGRLWIVAESTSRQRSAVTAVS